MASARTVSARALPSSELGCERTVRAECCASRSRCPCPTSHTEVTILTTEPSLPVGRWFGVPVRVHWTAFAALPLCGFLFLAPSGRFDTRFADWSVGLGMGLLLCAVVLAHLAARASVLRRMGRPVHAMTVLFCAGQLTAPEAACPQAEMQAALAGPAATALLTATASFAANVLGESTALGAMFVRVAAVAGLVLALSLVPAATFDGAALLHALLWRYTGDPDSAAAAVQRVGRISGWLLVLAGLVAFGFYEILGFCFLLVGWYVLAATPRRPVAPRVGALYGRTVGDAVTECDDPVPAWCTVAHYQEIASLAAPRGRYVLLHNRAGLVIAAVPVPTARRVTGEMRTRRLDELPGMRRVWLVASWAPLRLATRLLTYGELPVAIDKTGTPLGVVTTRGMRRAVGLRRRRWTRRHPAGSAMNQ
jgi:Zn-dependent protease